MSLSSSAHLASIIQSLVEQIEATVTANSFTFPSLDAAFSLETKAPRMHPAILSAGSVITFAAAQLIPLVKPALIALFDIVLQVSLAYCWMIPRCHGLLLTMWEYRSSIFVLQCKLR